MPRNEIIIGDNVLVLSEQFEDESVDLFVTSPPYDNLRAYGGDSWDFEKLAKEMTRVLVPGGVIVWVVADQTEDGSESLSSMKQAIFFKEQCGLKIRDTMIWEKSGVSAVGSLAVQYGSCWEYMFVISKGTPKTFNPIKDRVNKWAGTKVHGTQREKDGSTRQSHGSINGKILQEFGQRANVWKINEEKILNKDHPAVFPKTLATDHILSWSNPGDFVVDPFSGSGTTALAAKESGRIWCGIEVNPEYANQSIERLSSPDMFAIDLT